MTSPLTVQLIPCLNEDVHVASTRHQHRAALDCANSYLFLPTHCTATGDRMPSDEVRRDPKLAKDPGNGLPDVARSMGNKTYTLK